MLYDGYVPRLNQRFIQIFDYIMSGYNFDLGPEFEIAICQVLRQVLPQSFGVARGYVVARNGDQAGDDIIIYDRMRFPVVSARDGTEFLKKEYVPIEAVLAYIEAKHTLRLLGNDQNVTKAVQQVAEVKRLLSARPKRPLTRVTSKLDLDPKTFNMTVPATAPEYFNPPFTAILARQLDCSAKEFFERCEERFRAAGCPSEVFPDLMAAGPEVIALACFDDGPNAYGYRLPFLVPGKTRLLFRPTSHAFGIFVSALMHGLSWIALDDMPWSEIIGGALREK